MRAVDADDALKLLFLLLLRRRPTLESDEGRIFT